MANIYQINGREYEWADISIVLGGVPLVGIRQINYKREREKEHMHAKGRFAHSIQAGNEKATGNITLTQSQLEMLELASGGNLLESKFDIVVAYGAELHKGLTAESVASSVISTDVIVGAEFTEYEKGMSQGDKFMEVALPFLALRIINK